MRNERRKVEREKEENGRVSKKEREIYIEREEVET